MEKYTLDSLHRDFLRNKRITKNLSAEDVSEKLNHHKSWLGQIERGRLASIKKTDLDKLLSILFELPLSTVQERNLSDTFYADNLQPIEPNKNVIDKLSDRIDEILPQKFNSTSSFIKNKMREITDILCLEQDGSGKEFFNAFLALEQLRTNASENSSYTLLFLTLRFNEIFKKYKNNPEIILEIYDHIKYYLDSKLSDDKS